MSYRQRAENSKYTKAMCVLNSNTLGSGPDGNLANSVPFL